MPKSGYSLEVNGKEMVLPTSMVKPKADFGVEAKPVRKRRRRRKPVLDWKERLSDRIKGDISFSGLPTGESWMSTLVGGAIAAAGAFLVGHFMTKK